MNQPVQQSTLLFLCSIVILGLWMLACGSRPDYHAVLDEEVEHHAAPSAHRIDSPVRLPECVNTPVGCLELEEVYVAGVVECELGGLTDSAAALEAQAIALSLIHI